MITPPSGSFVLGLSAFIVYITLCSHVFLNTYFIAFLIIIGFLLCLAFSIKSSANV